MDGFLNYSRFKKANSSLDIRINMPNNLDNNISNNNYSRIINNDSSNLNNDLIFNLINEHKKRLQEIKEWENNLISSRTDNHIRTTTNINSNSNLNINNTYSESEKQYYPQTQENINYQTTNDFNKYNNNIQKSFLNNSIPYEDENNNNRISKLEYNYNNNSNNNSIINNLNNVESKTFSNFSYLKNNNSASKNENNELYKAPNYNYDYISNIKLLEHKLEQKKLKIKSLKANIELLTKQNEVLKSHNTDLENQLQNVSIINKKKLINEDGYISKEQNLLDKINSLQKEIQLKNEQIEKMKNNDKLKTSDIQLLNQKCRDIELIADENNKEQIKKIDKLIDEKNIFQGYINDLDKILFTINYFIKKVYNTIPLLNKNLETFIEVKNANELQKHLIIIENFMNGVGVPSTDSTGIKDDVGVSDLENKIKEITEQNMLLKKEIENKSINRSAKKAVKKSRTNSTNKGKIGLKRSKSKKK